uniref:Uncharacterized protein n=1 Tax=Molossus molossus TaxID=27622 RepID=A0A7J8DCH9_MOLMO|nr:hypothetical protein HJG59_009371 [Molossus molossus]
MGRRRAGTRLRLGGLSPKKCPQLGLPGLASPSGQPHLCSRGAPPWLSPSTCVPSPDMPPGQDNGLGTVLGHDLCGVGLRPPWGHSWGQTREDSLPQQLGLGLVLAAQGWAHFPPPPECPPASLLPPSSRHRASLGRRPEAGAVPHLYFILLIYFCPHPRTFFHFCLVRVRGRERETST